MYPVDNDLFCGWRRLENSRIFGESKQRGKYSNETSGESGKEGWGEMQNGCVRLKRFAREDYANGISRVPKREKRLFAVYGWR